MDERQGRDLANRVTVSREQQILGLILSAFVLLSLAASVINPLHEATDELRHYRFVRHIVQHRALPVQGQMACSAQGHHPPLFYALGALATAWIDTGRDVCYSPPQNPFWAYRYWEVGRDNKNQYLHGADEAFPWRGEALAVHLIRAVNVLIGAGVVWLTWAIGRTIWPGRAALAAGAAAFVAFNPMFVYMAGSINNDVLAAFSGAAVTLACVRLLRHEAGLNRGWGLALGGLYGLALMSKFNLAVVGLLIAAAVTWVAWRRQQWRLWWQVGALTILVAALIAGWWFVRNQLLYGEPTGFERVTELWGVRDPAESWDVALVELPYAWTSLWGRFGYGQIPLPEGIYIGLRWLVGLGLLGLALPLLRPSTYPLLSAAATGMKHTRWHEETVALLFLGLNVALFFAVLFAYLLVSPAGPMGRFFFPALPSLAVLTFYGLSQWLSLLPHGRRPATAWLALAANLGMAGLTLVALFGYLAPAYARPPSFAAGVAVPNPVEAQFDALVRLRGYDVSAVTVRPGEALDIDLYWEVTAQPPGDYLLFVHLVDEVGMVAQRDTHPGLGNFPSSQWQRGDRFVESLRLYVPETTYTPATAALSIGLYAPGAYRLGITGPDGAGLGDTLELGTVAIVPWTGSDAPGQAEFPNALNQNFNDEIRLLGYEYNQRHLRPGDVLALTLYWQAIQPAADYFVQVHLLDEAGALRAMGGGRPQAGQSPTDSWQPGQVVTDQQLLYLDPALPPATYIIHVALIDSVTQRPQNIIAEDGHWIDNRLLLARVQVQP